MDGRKVPATADVAFSILCYTAASSVMLVANKVAITAFPVPSVVFAAQISFTVAFVQVGKTLGWFQADDLSLSNIRSFIPYACSFVSSIYSNGKVLQHSNVETLITFRACSPLCVCVLDWALLGRELPNRQSLLALVGVVVGAVGYVLSDSEFRLHGLGAYAWVSVYLGFIVFEMTYGKMIISNISFQAPVWGSVLYTNTLALGPLSLVALASGEASTARSLTPSTGGLAALAFCCVAGTGISWAGWNCREKTSATTYTLLGVACKLISVLLNVLIWDKHASPSGIVWLVLCLASSSGYRQSPMRANPKATKATKAEDDRSRAKVIGQGTSEFDAILDDVKGPKDCDGSA